MKQQQRFLRECCVFVMDMVVDARSAEDVPRLRSVGFLRAFYVWQRETARLRIQKNQNLERTADRQAVVKRNEKNEKTIENQAKPYGE